MVYTGQPSRGCATCRKRRIKCDEKTPECGNCQRVKQACPGYVNQFDLAWRDQTTVAKKGVERGKQKRKAAREQGLLSSSSLSSGPLRPSTSRQQPRDKSSPTTSSQPPTSTSNALALKRSSISSGSQHASSAPIDQETKDILGASTGRDLYSKLHIPLEDQILTFFFNTYLLPIRDPLARRGFLEYLAPVYSNTDPESPFMLSTMAVASGLMCTRMGQDPNTTFSRSFYLRAVKAMRDQVSVQKACANDEMLIAVLLLQLYELSIGRLSSENYQQTHLNGALALIRHRGAENFKNKLSVAILLYVRSLVIDEAFRYNAPIPRDVIKWSELFEDSEQIPGIRLDSINLDLARLRSAASHILRSPDSNPSIRASQNQRIVTAAVTIDRRLKEWGQSLPESWVPTRVFGEQYIAPSIQKAGLYQQRCDVYSGLFLTIIWNKFRLSLIEVSRIIILFLDENPTAFNLVRQEACRNNIQGLVDDICACIPYFLGDRTEPGTPGDSSIKYPRAPGRPPIADHYQTGPTMGGWAILGPIGSLLRMDIKMREGQRVWIAQQVARTAKVYRIGKLSGRPPRG